MSLRVFCRILQAIIVVVGKPARRVTLFPRRLETDGRPSSCEVRCTGMYAKCINCCFEASGTNRLSGGPCRKSVNGRYSPCFYSSSLRCALKEKVLIKTL
jgi:hypothetical protein